MIDNSNIDNNSNELMDNPLHTSANIQQLQEALNIKQNELNACQLNIKILQETLEKSINVIQTFEQLLTSAHHEINHTGQQFEGAINQLLHDNSLLKSSSELWLNRAIKMELELIAANENTKKVTTKLVNLTEQVNVLRSCLTKCQCNNALNIN